MKSVSVALLPALIQSESLTDSTAVVIDVLRATSVMATALAGGTARIFACESIEQARNLATHLQGSRLLCGERGGLPIEGFDLGNSPAEYTPEAVQGKTIIITTTNGTRALAAVDRAEQVVTASFLNLSAVIEKISAASKVAIVCAGTDGQISGEDILLAGAIAKRLIAEFHFETNDDSTPLAIAAWNQAEPSSLDPAKLAARLAASRGGRNLTRIGYAEDLERVARIDSIVLVPTRVAHDPMELRPG